VWDSFWRICGGGIATSRRSIRVGGCADQAAMLARIDKQIRLLGAFVIETVAALHSGFVGNQADLEAGPNPRCIATRDLHGRICVRRLVNERWGVRRLQAQPAKIQGLYEE
jgi:hypothetical protein